MVETKAGETVGWSESTRVAQMDARKAAQKALCWAAPWAERREWQMVGSMVGHWAGRKAGSKGDWRAERKESRRVACWDASSAAERADWKVCCWAPPTAGQWELTAAGNWVCCSVVTMADKLGLIWDQWMDGS